MATVTSLTAAKILELAAGWDQVADDLGTLNLSVTAMKITLDSHDAYLTELNDNLMPALAASVAAQAVITSELSETTIPSLVAQQEATDSTLDVLTTVTLPSMQDSLDNATINAEAFTQTFFSTTPPVGTTDRDLQIGDIWYDTSLSVSSSLPKYRWNGTAWAGFSDAIPDLSIGVRKLYSTYHLIY